MECGLLTSDGRNNSRKLTPQRRVKQGTMRKGGAAAKAVPPFYRCTASEATDHLQSQFW